MIELPQTMIDQTLTHQLFGGDQPLTTTDRWVESDKRQRLRVCRELVQQRFLIELPPTEEDKGLTIKERKFQINVERVWDELPRMIVTEAQLIDWATTKISEHHLNETSQGVVFQSLPIGVRIWMLDHVNDLRWRWCYNWPGKRPVPWSPKMPLPPGIEAFTNKWTLHVSSEAADAAIAAHVLAIRVKDAIRTSFVAGMVAVLGETGITTEEADKFVSLPFPNESRMPDDVTCWEAEAARREAAALHDVQEALSRLQATVKINATVRASGGWVSFAQQLRTTIAARLTARDAREAAMAQESRQAAREAEAALGGGEGA